MYISQWMLIGGVAVVVALVVIIFRLLTKIAELRTEIDHLEGVDVEAREDAKFGDVDSQY
ncbi:hypothetical protein KC727_02160 [Candidatus Kaiserbacteria bacterium]|nr:hypothetical protein [Candidatus Kaiserbacteria bacterium]